MGPVQGRAFGWLKPKGGGIIGAKSRAHRLSRKLYVFLWERHLAATVSWLEPTPPKQLRLRRPGATPTRGHFIVQ